jgi:hypothetical protein
VDFSFFVPGFSSATFGKPELQAVCAVLQASAGGA